MVRAKGPKLKITKEQFDDYIKLVKDGKGRLGEAILQIQQKYNLPEPHKKPAVMRRLRRKEEREGVVILAKRKGWAKVKLGAEGSIPELSLEEGIEIMLTAFERARKYPKLEAELEKYKLDYANIKEKLRHQEEVERKHQEQAMRFKLAQQKEKIEEMITR